MLEIEQERRWTVTDAAELYEVANWGKGYFSVNQPGPRLRPPRQGPARGASI